MPVFGRNKDNAETLEPSRLTNMSDVAGLFHSFYNACKVKMQRRWFENARIVP